MDFLTLFAQIAVTMLALGLFFYLLYKIVVWTKLGNKGAFFLGAMLTPFFLGNIQDPDFRAVEQAKQLKRQEEDDSGDPMDPEER